MQFSYKVADAAGRIETGREEAASREELAAALKARGKVPLEIKGESRFTSQIKFYRFSAKERLYFTRQLSSLLNSGISLEKALAIIHRLLRPSDFQDVLGQIYQLILEGHSFSNALERYPRYFPGVYVNLIRAGESGGILQKITGRLAEYEEEQVNLKNFIVSSLIYPMILAGATVFVLLLYVGVVIPKFQTIFAEMESGLPLVTQIVMVVGRFFQYGWWVLPLLFMGMVIAFRQWTGSPEGRLRWDQLKLRIPYVGGILLKIAVARVSMTLSMLCTSGVPLLSGLTMAAEVSGNQAVSLGLEAAVTGIRQGGSLVKSLADQKIFPVLALEMIGVGEESGNLGEMLAQVGKTYEAEVKQSLGLFLSVFEPVLILIMVTVIGILAAAILLPIMDLNSQMGI